MQHSIDKNTDLEFSLHRNSYASWRGSLYHEISTSAQSTTWHAVIDPNADETLPGILWELDNSSTILPLFMNTMNHESLLRGPLFVPMHLNKKLLNWFFTLSDKIPLGILYRATATTVDRLFEHLQNLLECSLPGERKGVFRFYDPRVLCSLQRCGDKALKAVLAGPATALHAWEPGFEQAVLLTGENYFLEQEGFFLDQPLLDCISRQTTPYAVIQNMRGDCGVTLRAKPQNEALHFVAEICDALFELGVTDIFGCIIGTSYAMQVGHNVFKDDMVRQAIGKKIKTCSLADILRALPVACHETGGDHV